MKIGDIVKLHDSGRRNGKLAGQFGLVIDLDKYGNPVINVNGEIRSMHPTQIDGVVSETR